MIKWVLWAVLFLCLFFLPQCIILEDVCESDKDCKNGQVCTRKGSCELAEKGGTLDASSPEALVEATQPEPAPTEPGSTEKPPAPSCQGVALATTPSSNAKGWSLRGGADLSLVSFAGSISGQTYLIAKQTQNTLIFPDGKTLEASSPNTPEKSDNSFFVYRGNTQFMFSRPPIYTRTLKPLLASPYIPTLIFPDNQRGDARLVMAREKGSDSTKSLIMGLHLYNTKNATAVFGQATTVQMRCKTKCTLTHLVGHVRGEADDLFVAGQVTGDVEIVSEGAVVYSIAAGDQPRFFVMHIDTANPKVVWVWADAAGDVVPAGITSKWDKAGQMVEGIYVLGTFSGTLSWPGQSPVAAEGAHDLFLGEWGIKGGPKGVRFFGSSGDDRAVALAGRPGSYYMAGTTDTPGIDAGGCKLGAAGQHTLFIAQMNDNHKCTYANTIETSADKGDKQAEVTSIFAAPDKRLHVVGQVKGSAAFYGPNRKLVACTQATDDEDLFYLRFNPAGSFEDAFRVQTQGIQRAHGVFVRPLGNKTEIRIVGSYKGSFSPLQLPESPHTALFFMAFLMEN